MEKISEFSKRENEPYPKLYLRVMSGKEDFIVGPFSDHVEFETIRSELEEAEKIARKNKRWKFEGFATNAEKVNTTSLGKMLEIIGGSK
ncbi:MAG: hypothetical protein AAB432_02415 [Patescibacteria group bacterium]